DADSVELDVAAQVLGGLSSSRLDRFLVRDEQSAVSVSASVLPFQRVSLFFVTVDVKPGEDADAVSQRLDQIIGDFMPHGPTADEVQRVATQQVAASFFNIEQVGGFNGKPVALANGAVIAGDPGFFRRNLLEYGTVTPADVRTAASRWLSRPTYALRIDPG